MTAMELFVALSRTRTVAQAWTDTSGRVDTFVTRTAPQGGLSIYNAGCCIAGTCGIAMLLCLAHPVIAPSNHRAR
jgi:hypothetical protein